MNLKIGVRSLLMTVTRREYSSFYYFVGIDMLGNSQGKVSWTSYGRGWFVSEGPSDRSVSELI